MTRPTTMKRRRRQALILTAAAALCTSTHHTAIATDTSETDSKGGKEVKDDAPSEFEEKENVIPTTPEDNPSFTSEELDGGSNRFVNPDELELDDNADYGNHNTRWEDGPSSWEEFGHDNSACGLEHITVEEWEAGKYWERGNPVIVTGVTKEWAANEHWTLEGMLERYPDAEATMGDGRRVGEIGPDAAGNLLQPTTVKEFITKWMYHPFKYFFDRKIAIPKGMLEDCHPFPMPTRAFLDNPLAQAIHAPSKKAAVDPRPEHDIWMDHLAIAIGSDLQGLSFHHHGSAWNTVIFGKKRWILYDPKRWEMGDDPERHRRLALAGPNHGILPTPEWIRKLYPDPFRQYEIKNHGHDCIQHAGEMMFVPRRWMHMVVNIGDTVSVISEVGLEIGEGKKPEDFTYNPHASSDDDEEWSSDDMGVPPNDFIKIDADEDGMISRSEAKAYFKSIGKRVNLNNLWEMDDADGDGYISFDEFSGPKGQSDDESSSSDDYDGDVPNDFIKIDANEDGRISRSEAKKYFKSIGKRVNLNNLWEMDDADGDGFISFDEFSGPKGVRPDDSSDDDSEDNDGAYLKEE